jgi:hypothetical protein
MPSFLEHLFAVEALKALSASTLIQEVFSQLAPDLMRRTFYHKQPASSAKHSYLAVATRFVLF